MEAIMTDRVKQYIDIHIYDDMSNTEVNRLSKQKDRLKKNMTVEELESLKGKIDPREFLYGIKPRIEAKKRRCKA
jgi:hypothetical protein